MTGGRRGRRRAGHVWPSAGLNQSDLDVHGTAQAVVAGRRQFAGSSRCARSAGAASAWMSAGVEHGAVRLPARSPRCRSPPPKTSSTRSWWMTQRADARQHLVVAETYGRPCLRPAHRQKYGRSVRISWCPHHDLRQAR